MNAIDIRRRLLLGSAVGALALRPSRTAQADTNFTDYRFPATGAPTARTMPDRLSDVVNVKDWGALGNHSNNDGPAIQAAVNACISRGGGKVFLPPGTYLIDGPLVVGSDTADVGVQLIGSGKDSCILLGHPRYADPNNFGYTIIKGNHTYDSIERVEGMSHVSVKATRPGTSVVGCRIGPGGFNIALNMVGSYGASVHDCAGNSGGYRANDSHNTNSEYPGAIEGTIGIAIGTGIVTGCRLMGGWGVSYAASGNGSVLIGNSTENAGCCVRIGWGPLASGYPGEVPSCGCVVNSLQTERSSVGIELYNASGAFIGGNFISGTIGPPGEPLPIISNMTWSSANGGTVTVTTASPHYLKTGSQPVQLFWGANQVWASPPIPTYSHWDRTWGEVVMATHIDATHFTYPNPTNLSGARYSTDNRATWTYPGRYAIRCRKVYNSLITSHQDNLFAAYGTIDLDYNGEADHLNNILACTNAGLGYILPTNRKNLASWKFMECSGNVNWFGAGVGNPNGYMQFADLPGQAGVKQPPIEGQQYDISDGSLHGRAPPYAAGFADRVIGGGNGHYRVRFDGTYWRRVG
jgi:hypothetical protein